MNPDILKARDWASIALALALLTIIDSAFHAWQQESPSLLMPISLLALIIAVWGSFFALRKRHPVWADIMALSGVMLFSLMPDAAPVPFWRIIKGIIAFGFLILPFLIRLRLLIAMFMWTTVQLIPTVISAPLLPFGKDGDTNWAAYGTACSILVLFTWWLVGMRWRIGNGPYRSYAWIGLSAYVLLLAELKNYIAMADHGALPLGCGALICAAPLLFLLLKPRNGWQQRWPFYLCTCAALAVCAFAEPSDQTLSLIAVAYGALLSYIAVRQRDDHMLLYGAATIGVVVYLALLFVQRNHIIMGEQLPLLASIGAAVAAGVLFYYRVIKYVPKKQQEEATCTPFPTSKLRDKLLIYFIGLQIVALVGLILSEINRSRSPAQEALNIPTPPAPPHQIN